MIRTTTTSQTFSVTDLATNRTLSLYRGPAGVFASINADGKQSPEARISEGVVRDELIAWLEDV